MNVLGSTTSQVRVLGLTTVLKDLILLIHKMVRIILGNSFLCLKAIHKIKPENICESMLYIYKRLYKFKTILLQGICMTPKVIFVLGLQKCSWGQVGFESLDESGQFLVAQKYYEEGFSPVASLGHLASLEPWSEQGCLQQSHSNTGPSSADTETAG